MNRRRLVAASALTVLGVAAHHTHAPTTHTPPVKPRKHAAVSAREARFLTADRTPTRRASRSEQRKPLPSPTAFRPSDPTAAQWAALRDCESSGNYADNTGNGYYGAYQMDLDFWRTYGDGSASRADLASAAAQDAAARAGYDARGWEPWPECAYEKWGAR